MSEETRSWQAKALSGWSKPTTKFQEVSGGPTYKVGGNLDLSGLKPLLDAKQDKEQWAYRQSVKQAAPPRATQVKAINPGLTSHMPAPSSAGAGTEPKVPVFVYYNTGLYSTRRPGPTENAGIAGYYTMSQAQAMGAVPANNSQIVGGMMGSMDGGGAAPKSQEAPVTGYSGSGGKTVVTTDAYLQALAANPDAARFLVPMSADTSKT